MRSTIRTVAALVVAAVLVAVFLRNVELWRVGREIAHAHPAWLALSLATMILNLTIRAFRWQYLLEPLGTVRFSSAFRATAVGFAASTVLPARAGELIRPYFLARHERMSATGAFATVILERLLDVVTVLALLASFVFVFGRDLAAANPKLFAAVTWAGATAAVVSLASLVVLFVLAGDPSRPARFMARLDQVMPSALLKLLGGVMEKFAIGLGAIRRPGRLLGALLWSLPLWLSIAAGIWAVAAAFRLPVPFTGSFLLMAVLTLGVAVPTPGAVGGFHEAFRLGATGFFGAPDAAAVGAALVLHLLTVGPSLVLGLYFAARAGLRFSRMRELAGESDATDMRVAGANADASRSSNREPERRTSERRGDAA